MKLGETVGLGLKVCGMNIPGFFLCKRTGLNSIKMLDGQKRRIFGRVLVPDTKHVLAVSSSRWQS